MEAFKIEIARNEAGDTVMRCDNGEMTREQIVMVLQGMIAQLTEQIIIDKVTARMRIIQPGSLEALKINQGRKLQ